MSDPISRLTRRDFCLAMGAGCAALALPGCDSGAPAPTGTTLPPDMAKIASPGQDMASTCPAKGVVAAGAAKALAVGQAIHLAADNLYVLRDASGLYALTDVCTHEGAIVNYNPSTKKFVCPLHGSIFDQNGKRLSGLAISPLDHYAVCVDAKGDVVVDTATLVDATTRT